MRSIYMAGEEDLQPINLKISIYLESLNTERLSRYRNLMKERLRKKMEQQVKRQKSKSRSKAKEILTNKLQNNSNHHIGSPGPSEPMAF